MNKEFSTIFSALADETRLRILNLVFRREICVHTLTDILGENQPKISRHLAFLRKAGLVVSRREGKWIYYKMAEIENEHLRKIIINLIEWISGDERIQKDHRQLLKLQPTTTKESKEKDNISADTHTRKNQEKLEIHLL